MTQKSSGIRKRIPIRRRFLTTVLLTTVISIVAASLTGLFNIRHIRSASEETLTKQLELNLKNVIQEKVNSIQAHLEKYEQDLHMVTDYIEEMNENKEEMIAAGRIVLPPRNTKEYDMSRAFASADITESGQREDMLFYSNLEKIWKPIARENPNIIQRLYIGTTKGLLISYDRFAYTYYNPDGKEVIYNYYVSEWYKNGMKKEGISYTGVYLDFQGLGLTMTISYPFKNSSGETAGVACLDFDLAELYQELFAVNTDNKAFTFAFDRSGRMISKDSDVLDLQEYTGLSLDNLDSLREDPDGIMEIGDSVYVCVPVERVGWTLCAGIPKEAIREGILEEDASIRNSIVIFIIIVLAILFVAVIAVNKSVKAIIYPLELLRHDIRIISDGDLTYRAMVYRNDEIGDITSGMNEMVDRLNFTMNELISSQQEADSMSRLATMDTLTGIRNKTAFDRQRNELQQEVENGTAKFGLAMIDLNNLKLINDNYGHSKGDIAIKKLCRIICEVFEHSPVFRIGGDEFIAVLQNEDYENSHILIERFKKEIRVLSRKTQLAPWERVSAAIGFAIYNEKKDLNVESVFTRADAEMYRCKKEMKSSG